MRLQPDPDALRPSSDDLEALADAVREAGRVRDTDPPAPDATPPGTLEITRKGHLRVLRDAGA